MVKRQLSAGYRLTAEQVIDFSRDGKFLMAYKDVSEDFNPNPNDVALEEFSLVRSAAAKKGRLLENILKKDMAYPQTKYIGRDRYFCSYGNTVTIYNLKKGQKENLFRDFKPLNHIDGVTITNDTSKIIVFYDDVKCAVLDLNTGQVTASFRIISPDDQDYQRCVVNKDQNQLAAFFQNKVSFIDIANRARDYR